MQTKLLKGYSVEELKENYKRMTQAIDDLSYCLETLLQDQDEEVSSNEMYKQAFMSLSLDCEYKGVKSLSQLTLPKKKLPKFQPYPKKTFISPRKFAMKLKRPK